MADSPLNKANQIASIYSTNMGGATYGRKPKAPPVDDVAEPDPTAAAQVQQGAESSPLLTKLKAMFGKK